MIFTEKTITLKDGRNCILKPPVPEKAEEMISYLKQIAGETQFMSRYPDEIRKEAEDERAFLNRTLEDPKAVMIVAEADGKVVGSCSVFSNQEKRKIRRAASIWPARPGRGRRGRH